MNPPGTTSRAPGLHPSTLSTAQSLLSIVVVFVLMAVLAAIVVALARAGSDVAPGAVWTMGAVLVVVLVVFATAFAMRPLGLAIDREEIRLLRPRRTLRLERHDVASIHILSRRELGTPVRTGGVGGFFGMYGWFWTRKQGSFIYHATHWAHRHVAITRTDGRTWVATVDDVDAFVADAREKGWHVEVHAETGMAT